MDDANPTNGVARNGHGDLVGSKAVEGRMGDDEGIGLLLEPIGCSSIPYSVEQRRADRPERKANGLPNPRSVAVLRRSSMIHNSAGRMIGPDAWHSSNTEISMCDRVCIGKVPHGAYSTASGVFFSDQNRLNVQNGQRIHYGFVHGT
jgi:hypothetical protein